MGCLRGSSAALVNVVQDNVDDKVRRIIDTCSLDRKTAKVFGESVPPIELSKVDVIDFEGCYVLEGKQRHSGVERELFVSRDQASFVIWS